MPPAFLCNSSAAPSDCFIKITAKIQDDPRDLACYGGGKVNQVVVGPFQASATAFCGLTITVDNWLLSHSLPVAAKLDSLVDGDQKRVLDISFSLTSVPDLQGPLHIIDSIQVNFATSLKLKIQ